jgi:hypothetical protein
MNRDDILRDVAQTLKCKIIDVPGDLSDKQLNSVLGYSQGTAQIKRCRGDLLVPSYKVGRTRRTPLSAVVAFKLAQIQAQQEGMEVRSNEF